MGDNVKLTLKDLNQKYAAGEKLTMLSCYDASFAALMDEAGVEIFLVGDSLGMVIQGHSTPLPVTLEHSVYHTAAVARGTKRTFILGDLPFGTYQQSKEQAFASAAQLMVAGANMVKLEGGSVMAAAVDFLANRGIPVCGHLGLTPQAFNALGGFRAQGKTEEGAKRILQDAKALQDAGAQMLVLEFVPASVGKMVTAELRIPTIGIGAGPDTSGQILIIYDMLDVFPGKKAPFVRNFMQGAGSIQAAVQAYVKAVKDGSFPAPEHYF